MRVVLQPGDVTIDDLDANAADWTANHRRVFRVTYQDTGRGIDLKSSSGPKPGICQVLGVEASSLLLNGIRKIPGVHSAEIDNDEPNLLAVETLHRNGSDWEEVIPKVTQVILGHLCPVKKPSLISRLRGRAA